MGSPATSTKYHLVISGNQSGPFSEEQIVAQIKKGLIPNDALVWHDGLPDWQPISSIEYLASAFEAPASHAGEPIPVVTSPPVVAPAPALPPNSPFKPLTSPGVPLPATEATGSQKANTVPEKGSNTIELVFGDEGKFSKNLKPIGTAAGIVALMALIGVVFYYLFFIEDPVLIPLNPTPTQTTAPATRDEALRQALSELILKPDVSVRSLEKLIREKGDDAVAKEAATALVDYHKQRKRFLDAGRVLMAVGRPIDAIPLFLEDPPNYQDAEKAYFAAFETTRKREYLLDDIKLLVGPLRNSTIAKERLLLFQKEFPQQDHPFKYYLKSTEDKITDIFQRLSYYFVQSLLSFLNTEIPEIKFASRPIVEIKKDKQNLYRVTARYEGEVLLNQDRLRQISFSFWLHNDLWSVVDTNLTEERRKFSQQTRENLKQSALTGEAMLEYLETVFRTHYPKSYLHEAITAEEPKAKKALND